MQAKRTKIVCTMGPSTEDEGVLRQLIESGMNVARFNFSHGSHEYHKAGIERVRRVAAEVGKPVAILLDTKGPEVRTGVLENGEKVHFETGDKTIITTDDGVVGNHDRFSLDFKNLPNEVKPGDRILIDDGLLEFDVNKIEGTNIYCTLANSGDLGERKGVNIPGVDISLPAVTDRDREDNLWLRDGHRRHLRLLHPRRRGRRGDSPDLQGPRPRQSLDLPEDRVRPRHRELR